MKQQSDWFTGIDYYEGYQEQQIEVICTTISQRQPIRRHVQVELWQVIEGEGSILVNGEPYPLRKGSFFCLYSHHLYEVDEIITPVKVYIAKFHIGVFMHMMWEKHGKGVNARIVYDTLPYLKDESGELEGLMKQLVREQEEQQFGSRNMMLYLVLQLHMLFCRYALRNGRTSSQPPIWRCIQKVIVSPTEELTLQDSARELGLHPQYLNTRIKELCGCTFHDLRCYSLVINACALLHFDELSISYIADQLNVESSATFYRIFEQATGCDPTTYKKEHIDDELHYYKGKDLYLQVQQYLHQHFFQEVSLNDVAQALNRKPYTISRHLKEVYHTSLDQELQAIRIRYACALLKASDQSVMQIAMDCGFSSSSTFQRSFQKLMGMNPTAYRNL